MREIKFRVPIYYGGEFSHFLYWSNKGDVINFEPDDVLNSDRIFLTHGVREARDSEQFTGLRDKNGKEIYEGDILDDGAAVEWLDSLVWDGGGSEHPGFYCKKWMGFCGMEYHYGFEGVEVIGNIHENPELVAMA